MSKDLQLLSDKGFVSLSITIQDSSKIVLTALVFVVLRMRIGGY
nr:hypothetical protein [uncultured Gammaproteobacteria bacterium]